MSSIRILVLFGLLSLMASACGTTQVGESPNVSLSHSGWLGGSWLMDGAYVNQPSINKADFLPSSGPMVADTQRGSAWELGFTVDLRFRLAPSFYTGLSSHYVSFYGTGDSPCRFFNCQLVQSSTVNWWDTVTAEDVILKRSPSIGWVAGFIFGDPEFKKIVEYSLSLRRYELIVDTYEGIDCVGCVNSSRLKYATTVESGTAWRNTFKVGTELLCGIGWIELGAQQVSIGIGLQLSGPLFIEKKE